MSKEKKKKFEKPEAEIIQFSNEDIIVTSLGNGGANPEFEEGTGENW